MLRYRYLAVLLALVLAPALLRAAPAPPATAGPRPDARPSLLSYNTVQGLLSGDLNNTVTIGRLLDDLAAYPPDWPVVGVGTTNLPFRTGELMPGGTAGDPRIWWADPDSPSRAAVTDLRAASGGAGARFPFVALAVGDPSRQVTWTAEDVPDVHAWLSARMAEAGIELAGVLLEGEFGAVKTTVSYNIPSTGLDLSGGYVGADYFRFGEYAPAVWRMNGLYSATPALQPVIAAAGNPIHLHGFRPEAMIGGHITSAAATRVSVTVWPLDQLIVRRGSDDAEGQLHLRR